MKHLIHEYTTNKNIQFNQNTLTSFLIVSILLVGCGSTPPMSMSMGTINGNATPAAKQTADNNSQGPGSKGMSVYIDPQTGEFIPEPKPGQNALEITSEIQNATSTSSDGLVEEESPIPGGGVMIDLKGRFQSPLIITQDPNGKQKSQHLNDLPKYSPQQPTKADKKGAGYEQK